MFLSRGNRKCKDMWIFNLPAVKSCPNHKDCAKTCYALKAQRMYKTAREAREENFRAAKHNRKALQEFIVNKIIHGPYSVCRIHESGDFFSQAYIDMWARIAALCPDVKFYAYTKVHEMFDFSRLDGLDNVNIIPSYIGNGELNYGPPGYIQMLLRRYPWLIVCPATAKKGGKKCNVDCKLCQNGDKNVVFYQH